MVLITGASGGIGSAIARTFASEGAKLVLHHHRCRAKAFALHFMNYNFDRVHQTLRVTPAMEAGISDHVWSLEEIVGLAD